MKILRSALTAVVIVILSACSSSSGVTQTQSALEATNTPIPSATPTPLSTSTTGPARIILYTPPGSDLPLAQEIEPTLAGLAEQAGFQFERVSEPIETYLTNEVKLVVLLPPDPGIITLAQVYPGIHFLGIGIPGLMPSNNVSVIGAAGDRPDQQGFIAGYLSTVLTEDWRVGTITAGDTISGNAARNAFINGVVFFCGLCRPVVPPFINYPVYYDLSTNATPEEGQLAVDFLISQGVKTVYVYPGVGDQRLLESLTQAGIKLIGGIDPAANLQSNWIASVQSDMSSALKDIWPRIAAGEAGITVNPSLQITNRNETLFSPGRQRHVEQVLDELLSGYIDTGIDPLTGEKTY